MIIPPQDGMFLVSSTVIVSPPQCSITQHSSSRLAPHSAAVTARAPHFWTRDSRWYNDLTAYEIRGRGKGGGAVWTRCAEGIIAQQLAYQLTGSNQSRSYASHAEPPRYLIFSHRRFWKAGSFTPHRRGSAPLLSTYVIIIHHQNSVKIRGTFHWAH